MTGPARRGRGWGRRGPRFRRLLDAWRDGRQERTPMRYGARVGSLEAALGAPMTDVRRAVWSRIPIDRDQTADHTDDQTDDRAAEGAAEPEVDDRAAEGVADQTDDQAGDWLVGSPGAGTESLRVLDEDHVQALRGDPVIPSRAELDDAYADGEARGWDEQTARAWEYLDARREIADERAAAEQDGDTATVQRHDRRHAALDWNYLAVARDPDTPATGTSAADDTAERAEEAVEQAAEGHAERSGHESGQESGEEPAAVNVAQGPPQESPRWERPAAPDDLDALRTRVQALRAQLGDDRPGGRGESASTPQTWQAPETAEMAEARRAQLIRWAEDDARSTGRPDSAGTSSAASRTSSSDAYDDEEGL